MRTPQVPMPYYYGFIFQKTVHGWEVLESSTNGISPVNPSLVANYICRMPVTERMLHKVVEHPCQIVFCDDVYTRDEMNGFNHKFFLNSLRALSRIMDILRILCSDKMVDIHNHVEPTKIVNLSRKSDGVNYTCYVSTETNKFIKGSPIAFNKDGYKVALSATDGSLDALILNAFKDKTSNHYVFLSTWYDILISSMKSQQLRDYFIDNEDTELYEAYTNSTTLKIPAAKEIDGSVVPSVKTFQLYKFENSSLKTISWDVTAKEYAFKILQWSDSKGNVNNFSSATGIFLGAYVSVNNLGNLVLNIKNTSTNEVSLDVYKLYLDYIPSKCLSENKTINNGLDESLFVLGRVSKVTKIMPSGYPTTGKYNVTKDCYTINYDRKTDSSYIFFNIKELQSLKDSDLSSYVQSNAYDGSFVITYEIYKKPVFGINDQGVEIPNAYPQHDSEVRSYSAVEVILGENITNSEGSSVNTPIALDEFFDSTNRKVKSCSRVYGHEESLMTISLGGDLSTSKNNMHFLNYYTARLVSYNYDLSKSQASSEFNTVTKALSYLFNIFDSEIKITKEVLSSTLPSSSSGKLSTYSEIKSSVLLMIEKAKMIPSVLKEVFVLSDSSSSKDITVSIKGSVLTLPFDTTELGTVYLENLPLLTIQSNKNFVRSFKYILPITDTKVSEVIPMSTKQIRITSYGLNKREGSVVYNGFMTATTLDTPLLLTNEAGTVVFKMFDPKM